MCYLSSMEQWRESRIFKGRKISNFGRVWSPLRSGKILKLNQRMVNGRPANIIASGYVDGKFRSFAVHRLVLDAFVGPCPEGMEGCHNNGDPWDNRVENLRWDTHRNNMRDSMRHGTFVIPKKRGAPRRGQASNKAKITDDQAREVKKRLASGERCIHVARAMKVSYNTVTKISSGASWAWL